MNTENTLQCPTDRLRFSGDNSYCPTIQKANKKLSTKFAESFLINIGLDNDLSLRGATTLRDKGER